MAQYRIDPEQKAALDTINRGLDSVRILNTLILTDEDLCVSICEFARKRKKSRDSDTTVTIVQRAKAIREITALAKKHGIELDEEEKAVISAGAISRSSERPKEQNQDISA